MKSIMFVCTGNICRSPMAHWYTQYIVQKLGKQNDYLISSCGIYANDGEASTNNAKEAMLEYGVNMSNHRATNIANTNILDYDLIICMTVNHKLAILSMYPKLQGKVFTLKEYVDKDLKELDIYDPWGYDIEVYRNCAKEITQYVDRLLQKF